MLLNIGTESVFKIFQHQLQNFIEKLLHLIEVKIEDTCQDG